MPYFFFKKNQQCLCLSSRKIFEQMNRRCIVTFQEVHNALHTPPLNWKSFMSSLYIIAFVSLRLIIPNFSRHHHLSPFKTPAKLNNYYLHGQPQCLVTVRNKYHRLFQIIRKWPSVNPFILIVLEFGNTSTWWQETIFHNW